MDLLNQLVSAKIKTLMNEVEGLTEGEADKIISITLSAELRKLNKENVSDYLEIIRA